MRSAQILLYILLLCTQIIAQDITSLQLSSDVSVMGGFKLGNTRFYSPSVSLNTSMTYSIRKRIQVGLLFNGLFESNSTLSDFYLPTDRNKEIYYQSITKGTGLEDNADIPDPTAKTESGYFRPVNLKIYSFQSIIRYYAIFNRVLNVYAQSGAGLGYTVMSRNNELMGVPTDLSNIVQTDYNHQRPFALHYAMGAELSLGRFFAMYAQLNQQWFRLKGYSRIASVDLDVLRGAGEAGKDLALLKSISYQYSDWFGYNSLQLGLRIKFGIKKKQL